MKKLVSVPYTISRLLIVTGALLLVSLTGCAPQFYGGGGPGYDPGPYAYDDTVYPVYYEGHYFTPEYYRVHYGPSWQERFEHDRVTIVRTHPEWVHRQSSGTGHTYSHQNTYGHNNEPPRTTTRQAPVKTTVRTTTRTVSHSSSSSSHHR